MSAISHHYNPQVYLKRFTNPKAKNELWEYNLKECTSKQSSPKDSGCEEFYHSFLQSDGKQDNDSVEKSFYFVENNLKKLFDAIRRPQSLSPELWKVFFLFAAIQRSRNPKVLHSLQTSLGKMYELEVDIYKTQPEFKKKIQEAGLDPEKAKFDVKADRGNALLMLLSRYPKLAELFCRMKWSFFCAPQNKFFITSDDPVCCWSAKDKNFVGPSDPFCEITFPLSRRICAFGNWESVLDERIEITDKKVDAINVRTFQNAWHCTYASVEDKRISEIIRQSRQHACQTSKAN
ncbi:MAG TPA: DUF4238 domain-containing protein [Candidatus Limnocylindrales bacterium]|nr:DUF4238 domain-containing protein [Candidatus Limnocylindrales bacterium]